MKQSQPQRKTRARTSNRKAPRSQSSQNRVENRVRGNPKQLLDKYKTQARECRQGGDRIQAEHFYQFADHYQRVINEIRLGCGGVFEEYREVQRRQSDTIADMDMEDDILFDGDSNASDGLSGIDPDADQPETVAPPVLKEIPIHHGDSETRTGSSNRQKRSPTRRTRGDSQSSEEMDSRPARRQTGGAPRTGEKETGDGRKMMRLKTSDTAVHASADTVSTDGPRKSMGSADTNSKSDLQEKPALQPALQETLEAQENGQSQEAPKRRRGRPRKIAVQPSLTLETKAAPAPVSGKSKAVSPKDDAA